MSGPQLVEFPACPARDPVQGLRKLADDIEAGIYGEVATCAVTTFGDRLEVFGCGADSAGPTVALVLNAGALRIASEIERYGM